MTESANNTNFHTATDNKLEYFRKYPWIILDIVMGGGGYVTKGGVSSENLPNITTELYLYSNLPEIIRK